MVFKPLPIGIDDFQELITRNYYYVDKTWFIKELIDLQGKVNLFTRPRRFGKTLNLSMLRYFFEKPQERAGNKELFDGLQIMTAGESYLAKQEQYPVINLTLKSAKQGTYAFAYACLKEAIAGEYTRHAYVLEGSMTDEKREKYINIRDRTAPECEYLTALAYLSECLYKYHGRQTVILIDEYDVPLENSYFEGFYEEMIQFIHSFFESALKTNPYLEFAVITGCLRISKESIFTGLNNLEIISIMNPYYAEHFGFTPLEVGDMLRFYERVQQLETVKTWYDGYQFGASEVYNPWSVVNFVKLICKEPDALPVPYWANTSSNSIVRTLIEHAENETKQELERLIEGDTIEKPVFEDITYKDIYRSKDSLWNFLFFTGYLKKVSIRMGARNTQYITLKIPNEEIRYIYMNMVLDWFEQGIKSQDFGCLYEAIINGDIKGMEERISDNLMETISYYDHQESFYHGFLLGILRGMKHYIVISNQESGNGRPDIIIKHLSVRGLAVILEFKVTKDYQMLEAICDQALEQIEEQDYAAGLRREGYQNIQKYGVGFYRKECMVKKGN